MVESRLGSSTIDLDGIAELESRCREAVTRGHLPAVQVAMAVNGEMVIDETYGAATPDTRFHTYSAIKPLTSLSVLRLAHDGLIDLTAPVAAYLPEFGSNDDDAKNDDVKGKRSISVSQVLLHLGGFPHAPMAPHRWNDPALRREAYANWRLNWEPGSQYEYHATSAHWVLADVITAVTGRHHTEVVASLMTTPIGLPPLLGADAVAAGPIADVVSVGDPIDPAAMARLFGIAALPDTEVTDEALLVFNDDELRRAGNPGGGGLATASQLVAWYTAVMAQDERLAPPPVLAAATTEIANFHKDWMGAPANRTHAFVVVGDDGLGHLRGFGHTVSPLTFGHNGAKGQRVLADPGTGMAFALLTNGLDRNDLAIAKWCSRICTQAGRCVTTTH